MVKPKAIVSCDWHITQSNHEAILSIVNQKIKLAKELKVTDLFFLGDMFESRKAQPLNNLTFFESILDRFNDSNLRLICIAGNHDKVDLNASISYLSAYKHHPGMLLFETPSIHENIYLMPYFNCEDDTYSNILNECIKGKDVSKVLLLTHVTEDGATNNDGAPVKSGVSQNLLKKFKKVLSGHYHNKNGIYIGSIMPKNFGEDNEKGFTIINSDDSLTFHKAEFTEYHKVEINLETTTPKEIDKLVKLHSNNKKNNIRFEIKGDEAKLKGFNVDELKSKGIDVKLKVKEIEDAIDISEHNEFIEFTKETILVEFDEFLQENKISDFGGYGLKTLQTVLK